MISEDRYQQLEHFGTLDLEGLLAVERDRPRDVDLLVLIGQHYLRNRLFTDCFAYYSRALAIDPDDGWTYLYIGNLCYALSCYDEAETHFKRAIELLPDVACPYWALADVYDKQGYWLRTEENYRRAVEIEPSDDVSKRKLAEWLASKSE